MSANTVKSYIRTIYRKFDVASRTQRVLWGVEHGFSPDHHRIDHNRQRRSSGDTAPSQLQRSNLQWVISGYLLTYGGFLGGRAADLIGRRRLLA